jgi:hypothetical protein
MNIMSPLLFGLFAEVCFGVICVGGIFVGAGIALTHATVFEFVECLTPYLKDKIHRWFQLKEE